MDANAIIQVISTLGFPIATAIALFWYLVKCQKELSDVINDNTEVLLRILEHMKEDEKNHV